MVVPKFHTQKQLFDWLVKNKKEIISLKKATTKFTSPFSYNSLDSFANKSASDTEDLSSGIIKRTIVGNTYNWMDEHDDVHIEGVFTKSISENKNILHLHDHLFQVTAKVGTPKKVYEQKIKWTELGVTKAGYTVALLMDSEIKKVYNEVVFHDYASGEINQHSVGMQYVKLFMCVNDKDYKEAFANWNTYFPLVANQEKATDKGYFWAVTEAKLKEISCVIMGSNELTPTLNSKDNQPFSNTDFKIEPENSTQKKSINYSFLTEQLKKSA